MTSTIEDYRIESHEREGGLQSVQAGMPNVADDLRDTLRDMAALVRVTRGEGSPADVERLDIEPDADPMDAVPAWVDSWALDVHPSDSRVTILLTTGGPHIELDILTIPRPSSDSYVDAVEEVILRRSWPPACDRAWTNDERALGVVAEFLDLISRHH